MAKRNQVTVDLKIAADAQLKDSQSFVKQIEKLTNNFDFGTKINSQFEKAKDQLTSLGKTLAKVQDLNLISDEDLKNVTKASREMANLIGKTKQLTASLESQGLQKFSKEYIKQQKEQAAAIEKIKSEFTKQTGKNFDKELSNLDKYKQQLKDLERQYKLLKDTGAQVLIAQELDKNNKKLEEQSEKLKKIKKIQESSSTAYNNTLNEESVKRGYKNGYSELKGQKVLSEKQVRKQLGGTEYKKQANEINEINREIKQLENTKEENNNLDKAAIALAKKYKIEQVSNLQTLKEQIKLRKEVLNSYKGNKEKLADEEAVTAELEKQNRIAKDKDEVTTLAKQKELQIIQQESNGRYNSKGSLTAAASVTNRNVNELANIDVESITNNATNVIAQKLEAINTSISGIQGNVSNIENTNQQISTKAELQADESDIKNANVSQIEEFKDGTQKSIKATNDDGQKSRQQMSEMQKVLDAKITKRETLNIKEPIKEAVSTANALLVKEIPGYENMQFSVEDTKKLKELEQLYKNHEELGSDLERYHEMLGQDYEADEYKVIANNVSETMDDLAVNFEKIGNTLTDIITQAQKLKGQEIDSLVKHDAKGRKRIDENGSYVPKRGKEEALKLAKQDYDKLERQKGDILGGQEDFSIKYLDTKGQIENTIKTLNAVTGSTTNFSAVEKQAGENAIQLSENVKKAAQQSQYLSTTFDDIKNKVGYFLSLNYVFDQVTRKISEAVQTTKEMDKDMTQIGLVLGKTSGQVWKNFDTYSQMATRLNTTTSQVTNSMKLFYQQGLNTAEVNKMVEASAIAAALGESSMAEASETLTSIINSYSLSANDALTVTDKISQIAIVSAADFGELSVAIEKVASSAASAGLDLDHMMGYLAKMIETTREAPTNVGTALKTIVANFTQFKEDPSGLEQEGSAINKVDTALKSVGISLTDTTGEVKDLSIVLDELGGIWENLSRNQKSYLATQIAGTRQQSRFYALMNDYDRTLELVNEGSNSAGKSQQQFLLYSKSLEASSSRLKNQWEKFFNEITKGNGTISVLTDGLTTLMKVINQIKPLGAALGLVSFTRSAKISLNRLEELNNLLKDRAERTRTKDNEIVKINSNKDYDDDRKRAETDSIKNEYATQTKEDFEKLTKAEESYIKGMEKIKATESELFQKQKQATTMTERMSIGYKKLKNTGAKTFTTLKWGAEQVKIALVSLAKAFAVMMAIQLAAKVISTAWSGIKSAIGINTEYFVEQSEKASENASTMQSLTTEYETLSKKINKTAEEQKRLKEITEEVTKINASLGQKLKDNADNYEANVKAMKEYSDLQEKIASQQSSNAILGEAKKTNIIGLNVWEFFKHITSSKNEKEQDTTNQYEQWRLLSSNRAKENNLDDTRTSLLNKMTEQNISFMQNNNADGWSVRVNTDDFDAILKKNIETLKNLSESQIQEYEKYLKDFNGTEYKIGDMYKKAYSLDLPSSVKENLIQQLTEVDTSVKNSINNNKHIEDKDKAYGIVRNSLSVKDLSKLFTPDTSTLTDEELDLYNSDLAKFLNDPSLVENYTKAQLLGEESLDKFSQSLAKSGKFSDVFREAISSASKQLTSEEFKEAISNILKIGDLDLTNIMQGTASQLDILKELGSGKLDFQDLIVTEGGTLSVNTSKMVQQQLSEIDKIFNSLTAGIEKRKAQIATLDTDANPALKQIKDELDNLNEIRPSYYGNAEEYGGISGNIDLNARKVADLGNGQFGTEKSITIDADLGDNLGEMQYIIPTIINGIAKSEDDAIEYFYKTGEYIAAFTKDTAEETVEAYANAIHERQEEYHGNLNQDNTQKYLNRFNYNYEGGYKGDVNTASEDSIRNDALQKKIEDLDRRLQEGKKYDDASASVFRSTYAKRNVETGVKDTSSMNDNEKVQYIVEQNKALEESKQKVAELDRNSQDYYNTTYKIKSIQDDLKNVISNEPELLNKIEDKAKSTEQIYDNQIDQNKALKEVMMQQAEQQEKSLQKVKEKLSENAVYQGAYKGFFDGLTVDNTLIQSLDKVKTAYQQLDGEIVNTDQLQQTLAANPSLIQALDVTSQGLTWNKAKLEELGQAAIDESNSYIDSRIQNLEATRSTLEAQSDDIDNWSTEAVGKAAEVMSGNVNLTNTQQANAQVEAKNLGLSEQSWILWSDTVCKAIHNAAENYNEFLKSQANGTVSNTANGSSLSSQVKDIAGAQAEVKLDATKDSIKNALKGSKYSQDKAGAIKNINDQIKLLQGLKNSNKFKKNNIGKYLNGDLYNPKSGGSGSGSSKDSYDEKIEKLEHFYNYLRQIEKLEAKIERLRTKRSILDTTENYYVDNLIKENKLLKEQTSLYDNYINAQKEYLAQMRQELSSKYGDWVGFDSEGAAQVKRVNYAIKSEAQEERYNDYSELLNEYQSQYQTYLESQNTLLSTQQTIIENIKSAYEKINQQMEDTMGALERINTLNEHYADLSVGNIKQLTAYNKQLSSTVDMYNFAAQSLANLKADMNNLTNMANSNGYGQYMQWDATQNQYRTNDNFNNAVTNGTIDNETVTTIQSMVAASQALNDEWEQMSDKMNDIESSLKSIIENRLSVIEELVGGWKDELSDLFDIISREISTKDTVMDLVGYDTGDLEDKYKLVANAAAMTKTSWEETQKLTKKALDNLTKDYGDYVKMINGSAFIDEKGIQESTTLTDLQKERAQELITTYKQLKEATDTLEDSTYDYLNTLKELQEKQLSQTIDILQKIHDELKAIDQEELDDLQKKYDKMNQLDSEYYSKLSQRITDFRNKRNEQQQQQDLVQKQNQLAALQRDNSGQYNGQINSLQSEINQSLQSQADTKVDNDLEKVSREQDSRAEERDMQLQQLENLINFKDENKIYWEQANAMLNEGFAAVSGFLASREQNADQSELATQEAIAQTNQQLVDIYANLGNYSVKDLQTSADIKQALNDFLTGSGSGSMASLLEKLGVVGSDVNSNLITQFTGISQIINNGFSSSFGQIQTGLNTFWQQFSQLRGNITGNLTTTREGIANSINANGNRITDTLRSSIGRVSSQAASIGATDAQIQKNTRDTANSAGSTAGSAGTIANNTRTGGGGRSVADVADDIKGRIPTGDYSRSTLYSKMCDIESDAMAIRNKVQNGWTLSGANIGINWPFSLTWNKSKIYKKGGYANYTGPAWVDGTKSKPEAFLNARQTKLFEVLRDSLSNVPTHVASNDNSTNENVKIENLTIDVKELADTDSVDKVVKTVKESIYKDATSGNNMKITRRR